MKADKESRTKNTKKTLILLSAFLVCVLLAAVLLIRAAFSGSVFFSSGASQ